MHYIEQCKYGFMHRQCRCPGGSVSIVNCDMPLHKEVYRTGLEWVAIDNVIIADPDGWRRGDGVDLLTPIQYDDYLSRISQSTVDMRGRIE